MPVLVLKLVLTPLVVALATLAARRWGSNVGGLLAGLPLTSGPASVYFALEQGPTFARHAAQGTLLGITAVAAFCLAYARSARHSEWRLPLLVGLVAYFLVVSVVSLFTTSLLGATGLVLLLLVLSLAALGQPEGASARVPAPGWDLPLRMIAATVIALALTAAAHALGPRWSGLLSPFPVFALVMAVFVQRHGGAAEAHRLLYGITVGAFAFAAFFVVAGFTLQRASLAIVYLLASTAAVV